MKFGFGTQQLGFFSQCIKPSGHSDSVGLPGCSTTAVVVGEETGGM
jgi:hypothetical protein